MDDTLQKQKQIQMQEIEYLDLDEISEQVDLQQMQQSNRQVNIQNEDDDDFQIDGQPQYQAKQTQESVAAIKSNQIKEVKKSDNINPLPGNVLDEKKLFTFSKTEKEVEKENEEKIEKERMERLKKELEKEQAEEANKKAEEEKKKVEENEDDDDIEIEEIENKEENKEKSKDEDDDDFVIGEEQEQNKEIEEEKEQNKEIEEEQEQNKEIEEEKQQNIDKEIEVKEQKKTEPKEEPEDNTAAEHIALQRKFTAHRKGDSAKMTRIRDAVAAYLNAKNAYEEGLSKDKAEQRSALDQLIKACDSYTFGKFELFKRGTALARLQEVKALREEALQDKESLNSDFLISEEKNEKWEDTMDDDVTKASLGKKILAGVAGAFQVTFWNFAKLFNGNMDILYGFRHYYKDNVQRMNQGFTMKSSKLKSQTYQDEMQMMKEDEALFSESIEREKNTNYFNSEIHRDILDDDVISAPEEYEKNEKKIEELNEKILEVNYQKLSYNSIDHETREEAMKKFDDQIAQLESQIQQLKEQNKPYDKIKRMRESKFYKENMTSGYYEEDVYIEENYKLKDKLEKQQNRLLGLLKESVTLDNVSEISSLEKEIEENRPLVKEFASYMKEFNPEEKVDMSKINAATEEQFHRRDEMVEQVSALIKEKKTYFENTCKKDIPELLDDPYTSLDVKVATFAQMEANLDAYMDALEFLKTYTDDFDSDFKEYKIEDNFVDLKAYERAKKRLNAFRK